MPQSLADAVRAKYPGSYDNVDDDTLEQAIVAKHPEYRSKLNFQPEASPALKVDNPDLDKTIASDKEFLKQTHVPEQTSSDEVKPTAKAEEKPGLASRIWKGITETPDKVKEFSSSMEDYLTDPRHQIMQETGQGGIHDEIANELARFRGGIAGSAKAAIDQFTTPANLALAAAGLTEAKAASPIIKAGAKLTRFGVSAPVAYHGLDKITSPDSSWSDRAAGVAELAGGILGMTHGTAVGERPIERIFTPDKNVIDPEFKVHGENESQGTPEQKRLPAPRARQSTEIPYRYPEPNAPSGAGTDLPIRRGDINDDFTRGVTETRNDIVPTPGGPEFAPTDITAAPPEQAAQPPATGEDQILENARRKFGMGGSLPETGREPTQTEFTRPDGSMALTQPTPERVQQLTEQGYQIARTLPNGTVVLTPAPPKSNIRNPFAQSIEQQTPPPQQAPQQELPVRSPINQALAEPQATPEMPQVQFAEPEPKFKQPEIQESAPLVKSEGLPAANENESVMDYHNRTGASITDSERMTGNAPEENIEPSFARTESGGVRMDIGDRKAMINIFKNTYAGKVSHVAAKELVQNALDAAATKPGGGGNVMVRTSEKNHTITVNDNGKGLNRDEIDTVFTNLSSSGKRGGPNKTAGELGVGKTTYLVAGEKVHVSTVHQDPRTGKKIKIEFGGTPDEIIEGVNPVETEVPDDTPTGTTVALKISNNETMEAMTRYFEQLKDYSSMPVPVDIKHESHYAGNNMDLQIPPTGAIKGKKLAVGQATINGVVSTKFKLTIPDNAKWGENDRIHLIINNRGMFQGVDGWYTGKAEIPDRIVVELDPEVPGDDNAYPLTAPTRERLKEQVKNQIGQVIDKDLVSALQEKRKKEIQRIFDKIKSTRGIAIYNGGERYTPEELKDIQSSRPMIKLNSIVSDMMNELHTIFPTAGKSSYEPGGKNIVRVGFIFDDLRGVNLKNPADAKEIIVMYNPFSEISEFFNDPVCASQGILHIGIHEFNHVHIRSEGSDFTAHLASLYAKFDLEKQIEYRNRILKAITGGSSIRGPVYNPEIEKLLYKYTESRGRPKTGSDILLREAGSYVLRLPKSKGSSGDGGNVRAGTPSQQAIDKLFGALEEARSASDEQRELLRAQRAERFSAFGKVRATGMKGAASSLSKLKGEYEKVDFESRFGDSLNEKDVDALFTAIKRANITNAEKARGYTSLFKLINGDGLPDRSELSVLDDVFGNGFSNRVIEMHGSFGGVPIKLAKLANTMKSLRSSLDISAPLRQGLGLIHKKEWWSSLGDAMGFLGNKEAYDYAMHMIQKDKYYLVSREAGLFLAKPDDLVKGEEVFMNSYVHNIPKWTGIPTLVDASERAYTGFLNELRFRTFKSLIQEAADAGLPTFTLEKDIESGGVHIVTTKLTDDLAKMINNSTGRGSLGKFNKIANEINAVIWSPKYLASRLEMLNPKYYMQLDPMARQEAIKSLLAIVGFGIGITSLSAIMGGKSLGNPLSGYLQTGEPGATNWLSGKNPQMLSTDFGKSRFGNNVVDPYTGFQQILVGTARIITGVANGKPQSANQTLGNFVANKLSPAAALAYEVGGAKKWTGKGNFTDAYGQTKYLPAEIANSFVPMFVQDVRDVYKSDATLMQNIGLDTGSLFGMGIQQYPEQNTNKAPSGFRKLTLGQ